MYGLSRRLILPGLLASCLLLVWPTLGQVPFDPQPRPQPPGPSRGPSALAFTSDGNLLCVAEQYENKVALLEPDTGKMVGEVPTGGEQPTGIALSADGRTLAAANNFSGSLGLIDLQKRNLRATVRIPGQPFGVAITPAGRAFVSVSQLDEVVVVDMAAARVTATIPVGHHPHTVVLLPDGKTLLCAGMIGGSLSLIDTATCKERARFALPATNIRGIALSADGTLAYVTCQQPHNDEPTSRPEYMWANILCIVRLSPGAPTLDRILDLDQPTHGAADPTGIALDSAGTTAYAALAGAHEVTAVPLAEPVTGPVGRRIAVGINPRAIAPRPAHNEIWVANHLGNSLTVLATTGNSLPRTVRLEPPSPTPSRRLKGLFFFTSAHLARGGHFTCETCHPETNSDGLSWRFAHVHDGLDLRNTRDLRGNILLTGPYGWSGREEDFEAFVNAELVGLMRTRKMVHKDVHAFWDLINESPLPQNPYRNSDGTFTAGAVRGKSLLYHSAGCVRCHLGDQHGGVEGPQWIGTTPKNVRLDVPHLVGVYESAPYLHDGRARTLEEIFTKYDPDHLHGAAHRLSADEMKDLLEFVREL